MALARADLESLLRRRNLDRTLAHFQCRPLPAALPATGPAPDEYATAATGVTGVDRWLGGGFPRGQISELVGARSSGRTSLLLQMLAAATARGELAALVDVLDMLDVPSAAGAGVDFHRLLWIRGLFQAMGPSEGISPNQRLCRDLHARSLERALKALTLVLEAGNFGLVVFDAAEMPSRALQQLPFTTWRRLHRLIAGSQTVCLIVADSPVARSAGGITVRLDRAGRAGEAGGAGSGLHGGDRHWPSRPTCPSRPSSLEGLQRC